MEAPVVPITLAITEPKSSIATLSIGVDFLSTLIKIPPDATNRDASNAINERYSANVWTKLT